MLLKMWLKGKTIMAAGRIQGPRLITFVAMISAVIRLVTKMAVIMTNRCETFIVKSSAGDGRIKACSQ